MLNDDFLEADVMMRNTTAYVFGILVLLSAVNSKATSICDDLSSIDDGKSTLRVKNCEAVLQNIPNKDAATFTMQYFKDNYQHLADSSCAEESSSVAHGVLSKTKVDGGIQNGCQMVLNDTQKSWPGFPNRMTAYYVDLCATDSKKAVTKFYMNKGTGSSRRGFSDSNGAHTTLAGAFLTDDQTFAFRPYKMSKGYTQIKKQLGGKIPALRLVGLNSSNNTSEYSKPIHASPYKSSWGCPSVAPENAWIMQKLASNGPSLLMNYGPSSMHQSTTTCHNQSSPAKKSGSSAVKATSKKTSGSK
jgi:hypothetical protein